MRRKDLSRVLCLSFVLAAALGAMAQETGTSSASSAVLESIQHQMVEGRLEVLIKINGTYGFEAFELVAPKRLVIDLTPVEVNRAEAVYPVEAAGVIRIRTGKFQPTVTRIVFDLMDAVPSHRITTAEAGIRISFWVEEEGKEAAVPPEVAEESKVEPKPEIPAVVPQAVTPQPQPPPPPPPPAGPRGKMFFLEAEIGLGSFLKPDTPFRREFPLYGETGSMDEAYKIKGGFLFGFNAGRHFKLGGRMLKVGFGFNSMPVGQDAAFSLALPHPFIENAPRNLSFTESYKVTLTSFYGFIQYPFVYLEKFRVWLGPLFGYASSKFTTLDDWEIEEEAPFNSSSVTILNKTFVEDSLSGLLYGGLLSLEYVASKTFSVFLKGDLFSFKPKIQHLEIFGNYAQFQAVAGIQVKL